MALFIRLYFVLLTLCVLASAEAIEEFRVYTEQPRLILRPQRLRLLKRERDRQSMRWEQFNTLMSGHARMPEPGFSLALLYAVTGDAESGRQAIEWAASATDIRQIALVYDWCHPAMTPAQSKTLETRLSRAVTGLAGKTDLGTLRDRSLAAIAIAGEEPSLAETALRDIVENAWRKVAAPRLGTGADAPDGDATFALYEMLHAIRDNLNIDLREDARAWFRALLPAEMLRHYPSPYPAPENEYWIPAFDAEKAPDLRIAALSRAAELAMVAYDNNANDSQFLQGWLMQDRFLMRSAFGVNYEFLWANPYQPGLSYSHFPLAHHDAASGSLFVRSSWDSDAVWFGKVGREWQMFEDGKITALNTKKSREPVTIGETVVFFARDPVRFAVKGASRAYVIGLQPRTVYEVEVDDEEMREETSDGAGTVEVLFGAETSTGVRLCQRTAMVVSP